MGEGQGELGEQEVMGEGQREREQEVMGEVQGEREQEVMGEVQGELESRRSWGRDRESWRAGGHGGGTGRERTGGHGGGTGRAGEQEVMGEVQGELGEQEVMGEVQGELESRRSWGRDRESWRAGGHGGGTGRAGRTGGHGGGTGRAGEQEVMGEVQGELEVMEEVQGEGEQEVMGEGQREGEQEVKPHRHCDVLYDTYLGMFPCRGAAAAAGSLNRYAEEDACGQSQTWDTNCEVERCFGAVKHSIVKKQRRPRPATSIRTMYALSREDRGHMWHGPYLSGYSSTLCYQKPSVSGRQVGQREAEPAPHLTPSTHSSRAQLPDPDECLCIQRLNGLKTQRHVGT
ncbi:hypothetical protein KUCAC02_015589 [Chaenocephalus aceratus]|uniref:Uncharacterized protein n=1 Tax=Chaenocephalus aceratus TaxID=36190 RepID=A0ACB9XZS2_CHAAC|nr:hypothetical protein KUCAC02_015589 [Chaenocephalus aceratus]